MVGMEDEVDGDGCGEMGVLILSLGRFFVQKIVTLSSLQSLINGGGGCGRGDGEDNGQG